MSLRARMKFCWKRFRHFVAAYFVLGLSATLAHSAITVASFDVFASEESEPVPVAEVSPPPAEESPAPEADIPVEENVAMEDEAASPEDATPVEEDVTPAEEAPSPITEGEVIAEQPTEADQPVSDEIPVESEVIPAEGIDAPAEGDTSAPDSQPESGASDAPAEPAPVETEPVVEEAPDSWPEERLEVEPEPYVEPEPSPYLEARGTLESVVNKIDWLYTLRPEANYDVLSMAKIQTSADMLGLADLLEAEGSNNQINTQFCALENDLETLNTVLASGSDDSQPEVDADNQEVLAEITAAIMQVQGMWTNASGQSLQCN